MKKLLISMIVVVMVLAGCMAIFAACDGAGSGDYDRTIIFYSSQGQDLQKETQAAIKAFEDKYPGWKVDHVTPGGYNEVLSKVRSDLQAGLQPDLAYCYADHVAQYLATEKVVDMSKFLTSNESFKYTYTDDNGESQTVKVDHLGFTQEDVNKFVPGYLDEGYAKNFSGVPSSYSKDALFMLPFVKSTELLYYNEKSLKELNLQPAKTWAELWTQCATIKAKWPGCTPLGYDSEANWFITMAEQKGFGYTSVDESNHYLFNNDGAKAWLNEIAGYYAKGYITTQEIYGSYTSGLFAIGPEAGGLVYCIGSSGGASHQKGDGFTTGVTAIPGVDADHSQSISQGPNLVMLTGGHGVTNSKEKEKMTFLFVKELLDVKFQATFAKASGYNPMRTDVFDQESYKDFLDSDTVVARAALAASSLSDKFFTSPAFVGSSTAREQVGNVVQYVLLNQKTAEKALKDAYKNCGGK